MGVAATVERTVDSATGEVVSQAVTTVDREAEPDYVKLYVRAWIEFKEIKGINSSLLAHLLPYVTYARQGQRIILSPILKREIAHELGWAEKTALQRFNNELRKLCAQGVLRNVGENTYAVNPELVGKGSWADIKLLRATFNVIGPKAGKVTVETDRG